MYARRPDGGEVEYRSTSPVVDFAADSPAPGAYWKAPFEALEDAASCGRCWGGDLQQSRAPGRSNYEAVLAEARRPAERLASGDLGT